MALRLKKDVQKASYYVWFLGAEEARGLRGPRVLLPAIPYLIERSRDIEPIKVTLQVSQKGMKIVQGSSKHFITHSAITCSMQTDDIVACVLLLYNPITKCPLHVHAYRCDSQLTAQALNQQLQILINRPENQKRFAELESRLGIISNSPPPRTAISPPKAIQTQKCSEAPDVRKFDSSLGSDTGTSTRESECSEEHTVLNPVSPGPAKSTLFDSLAAELRAKLNGNGPPLLLPPRDYDTVHRAKGNLAATELRRCRNSLIVGTTGSKHGVSSRGSSGIGSDLAPSPERQEGHSSSDEEWVKKKVETEKRMGSSSRRLVPKPFTAIDKPSKSSDSPPPSYLYSLDKPNYIISKSNEKAQLERVISNHIDRAFIPKKEEEIKPKLVRPRNLEAHFKQILQEKRCDDETDTRDYSKGHENNSRSEWKNEKSYETNVVPVTRTKSNPMKAPENVGRHRDNGYLASGKVIEHTKYGKAEEDHVHYRENLTDKQKYRESMLEKQRRSQGSRERYFDDNYPSQNFEEPISSQPRAKSKYDDVDYTGESTVERQGYRQKNQIVHNFNDLQIDRNPYRQSESLPYRESIERMIKSPAIRYKSFDGNSNRNYDEHVTPENERYHVYPPAEKYREARPYPRDPREYSHSPVMYEGEEHHMSRHRYKQPVRRSLSRSPDVRISPKGRYDSDKEFHSIERDLGYSVEKINSSRRNEPPHRGSVEMVPRAPVRNLPPHHDIAQDWSSEDDCIGRSPPPPPTSSGRPNRSVDHTDKSPNLGPNARMTSAKSLGNLVKGYRHSYAEPRNPMPRNSGRVGLAAVNPF